MDLLKEINQKIWVSYINKPKNRDLLIKINQKHGFINKINQKTMDLVIKINQKTQPRPVKLRRVPGAWKI